MLTWIIPDKLGKAGAIDIIPDSAFHIRIANELDPHFAIWDTDKYDTEQQSAINAVVSNSLRLMAEGGSVVLTCVEGRSRSPGLACLVASFWNKTDLDTEYHALMSMDSTVRGDSPILDTIRKMDREGMFNRYRRMIV